MNHRRVKMILDSIGSGQNDKKPSDTFGAKCNHENTTVCPLRTHKICCCSKILHFDPTCQCWCPNASQLTNRSNSSLGPSRQGTLCHKVPCMRAPLPLFFAHLHIKIGMCNLPRAESRVRIIDTKFVWVLVATYLSATTTIHMY